MNIEIPLGKRKPLYRFFEMVPALLTYTIILLPFVLSYINPLYGAVFVVGFIISWFVKAIGVAFRILQGYNSLNAAQKVDWQLRLKDLEEPAVAIDRYATEPQKGWRIQDHMRNLVALNSNAFKHPKPSEVYNAVIVATYNESRDIIEPTIKDVVQSDYDRSNLILLIAYEERGGAEVESNAKDLIERYGKDCFYAEAIKHPSNIPDEVIGKGGNITFAGKRLQEVMKKKGVDPSNVIVTTLDADNRPHKSYFAYTTYEYIVHEDREYRSFQPISLFLNNIWDVPAPMRVLATGNSFWTIINSVRPHMLRNFASHSQGLSGLLKTDFWSVRTIVEDGHQYWRSYFAFKGRHEVTPIFVPIYQDAVLAETYTKTLKAQFTQLRRWAYGASDVAYVGYMGFKYRAQVPFLGFIARLLRLIDSHVSWAAAPIIITFGAWIPILINSESARSIVAHELPQVASALQRLALIGLFITVYLAFRMLPPRPERYKRRRNLFMLAQWALMPIISICYGSSAALNAQTRLLIGKYLDKFDVTVKAVKK